ncbi:MAG: DUF2871 family protein [Planctomycetota bacterium]
MPLPEHYRRFYRFNATFALLMLVVGGIAGLVYVEITRPLDFAKAPPGVHLEATYRLAILHGHCFLVGAIVPMIWVLILQTGRWLGAAPVGAGALRWSLWTYVPGALGVIGLLGYKGWHYTSRLLAYGPDADFDRIHAELFGGSRAMSGAFHGISHTVATVGLIIFTVAVLRSFGRRVES